MGNNFSQDTVQWRETIANNLKDTLSMNTEHVTNQVPKLAVVWAAWGITTWQEAAGFLAFVLSALAFCEWVWKKALRPFLVWRGYAKPIKRKYLEVVDE